MIENYKIITVNHSMIDVSQLGQYMVNEKISQELTLQQVKLQLSINEILYLATCNRVTYLFYTNHTVDTDYIGNFLQIVNPHIDKNVLEKIDTQIALYEGAEAVRHLMEIAGSIDSMVVGEREIFRQFREAYDYALSNRLCGDNLRLLEKKVTRTSKSIYTNTRIGEKPLSVAALAMSSILANVSQSENEILFIGAGSTNKLMAKLLKPKNIGKYTVINRSQENALKLSKYLEGASDALENIGKHSSEADIIVVCTASQNPILTSAHNINASKTVIIVDLSVPRNVEDTISSLPNVKYIHIDHLKILAQKNLEDRRKEIGLAKQIIDTAIEEFKITYQERQLELALSDLPSEIKKVKEKAIQEVYASRLQTLDPESKSLLLEMLDYMEKKCVSIPMKAVKKKIQN